jgi:hypothetical protein
MNSACSEGITAYVFGNMEERNDGIACHALVEVEGLKPGLRGHR